MWHGGGWFMYVRGGDEKPKVTRELLLRVLSYARGYWWHIAGMLVTGIAVGTIRIWWECSTAEVCWISIAVSPLHSGSHSSCTR